MASIGKNRHPVEYSPPKKGYLCHGDKKSGTLDPARLRSLFEGYEMADLLVLDRVVMELIAEKAV